MLAQRPRAPPTTLAVDVINASEPTLCAEKDNVYLKLQSRRGAALHVEAVHPAYIGTIVDDRWAPDFTKCDMSNDPAFNPRTRRLTIYEDEEWQLVGHHLSELLAAKPGAGARRQPRRDRLPSAAALDALPGARRGGAGALSADGYWRARPLPPANLRWSAYGSSFLIGPVETQGRPFVDIKDVAFDPDDARPSR